MASLGLALSLLLFLFVWPAQAGVEGPATAEEDRTVLLVVGLLSLLGVLSPGLPSIRRGIARAGARAAIRFPILRRRTRRRAGGRAGRAAR